MTFTKREAIVPASRAMLCLVAALAVGCLSQSDPAGGTAEQAPTSDPEAAVRAAISKRFEVRPSAIDMDRRLCDAPFKADDLDLVELVMEIEERLGVTIPDERVEELLDGQLGKVPIRITPAQLVTLAKQAKSGPRTKKR